MGATAGLLIMGAGVGLSASSTYQAGKDNAATLRFNREIAEVRARDAIARGQAEEARYRLSVRQLVGEQRAAMAAQGLDLSFGSALDLQMDAAYFGELDALTIRNNAAREAWGYRMQGLGFEMQADQSERAGTSNAFATMLGGAGQAYLYTRGMRVPQAQTSYGWRSGSAGDRAANPSNYGFIH